jgi:hypothetical protein
LLGAVEAGATGKPHPARVRAAALSVIATFRRGPLGGAWIFGVVMLAQIGHLIEHIAVKVQGSGLLGTTFDNELSHLLFNGVIALWAVVLVVTYPRNPWVYPLVVLSLVHGVEHIYIFAEFVRLGVSNGPGVLARGGVVGIIPLVREDLHNVYNGLEAILMVLGFSHEVHATFLEDGALPASSPTRRETTQ